MIITEENPLGITKYLTAESRPLFAQRWQQKFVNWTIADNITFSQVASDHFRDLLLHSGPDIEPMLPKANTVKAWILRAFQERRAMQSRASSKLAVESPCRLMRGQLQTT